MRFSYTFIVIGIGLASVVEVSNARPLCTDYSGVYAFGPDDCSARDLIRALKAKWGAADEALAGGCPRSFFSDFRTLFTAIFNPGGKRLKGDEIKDRIDEACDAALAVAASKATATASWNEITAVNVDFAEFFDGDGFLNNETGNFQQDPDDFDNPERFIYQGADPRKNDHYPTTEDSYQVGVDIDAFQSNVNTKKFLEDPLNFEGTCKNQAMMCCWHRDRQYKDGNGDCKATRCVNSDPADNTNLCWTEDDSGDPIPYPGDEDEGDLHCHGLAWGSKLETANDLARFNNLFYVSAFDHMYTRGYVESITNNELIENIQPMCGCIEEMNPVSRADCTEALPVTNYTVTLTSSTFDVAPVDGTFSLEFEACQGYIFEPDVDLDELEFEDALGLFEEKENDLSAFVFRLYLEGKMSEETMYKVFHTLVGYEDPNDNENEDACRAAFANKFEEIYPDA